jgi:4-phytase/acid phosphatase
VFNGTGEIACKLEPAAASAAMLASVGPDGLDTPATREAMTRLQAIVAPDGCKGGKGYCFTGDDTIADTPAGPRVQGPLSVSASLAEDLLLEYAEGMPRAQVGWGRAGTEADIAAVMPVHEQTFGAIRHNAYVGARQGALMGRMIVAALNGAPSGAVPGPQYGPQARLVDFSGHDLNIALMGALFGLDWTLPGEPDVTSPAETLALELWSDPATGKRYVRAVMYYETLDQLRSLKPALATRLPLRFKDCAPGPGGGCPLDEVSRRALALIPASCGEI